MSRSVRQLSRAIASSPAGPRALLNAGHSNTALSAYNAPYARGSAARYARAVRALRESMRAFAAAKKTVLVCLDSNHTHAHVLAELEAYAPLTTRGSYCVVFDTLVDDMPKSFYPDRPWGPGDNPKSAVREFLASHPEFASDRSIDHKLLVSVAPEGYLRRLR